MCAVRVGEVAKLVRYPVKSMAGMEESSSILDWHGLSGDRRIGVRQVDRATDFPWLTAGRMPELLRFRPGDIDRQSPGLLPTSVLTPSGASWGIYSDELREEIGDMAGCSVELMALKHGIYDDSVISVIATPTVTEICSEAGVGVDSRRFRANIEISGDALGPFADDEWVGRMITIGESPNAPAIFVTKRDERCRMISLDPDTADHDSRVLATAMQLNDNHAGVYGTVVAVGTIQIGDSVYLHETTLS